MTEQDNSQPDQQKHPNPTNPQLDQPDQHIGTANPQKNPDEQPENPIRQQNKGFSVGLE